MNLYTTKLLPTSVTVTSAQTGYDASNLVIESIARNWRSTDTTQQDVEFLFAAGKTVQAVHVHDVNFTTCEVYVKTGAGAYGAKVGDLATYKNKEGRLRGFYVIGGTANVTGIKLRVLNGAASDGLSYKRIGAMYVFGAVVALTNYGPEWGYNPVWKKPRVTTGLVNGKRAVANAGTPFHLITGHVKQRNTEDWTAFFAGLDAGTCLFVMNLNSPRQWQSWPVILENDEVSDQATGPNATEYDIMLREVV